MIKILIADNHLLIREGIKSLLSKNKDIQIVGEATGKAELFNKIKKLTPDIVLLDFNISSFQVDDIVEIRQKFPLIKIVVITTSQNKQDVLKILEYGVNNYILKECDEGEIMNVILSAAKGERFFCSKVIDAIMEKHYPKCEDGGICNNCEAIKLSIRETEIIKLVAEGVTTKQIAGKLNLSYHTITTHRKNIFKKLKLRSTSELILYAIKKEIFDPKKT